MNKIKEKRNCYFGSKSRVILTEI